MRYGIREHLGALAAGTGALIARNPIIVGGATAFLVTLFYVSANAIWYQPYAHKGAFFATRDFGGYKAPVVERRSIPQTETRIRIERGRKTAHKDEAPEGDPVIARVQRVLADLKLYSGPVDGLSGPMTKSAVESYQRIVGLEADGEITRGLLDQIDGRVRAGTVPVPRPAPQRQDVAEGHSSAEGSVDDAETTASIAVASDQLKRIQAGLRAFGNDQIEIDGLSGAKTSSAILEFQSLFGLPETGNADQEVVAKMREIGLID